MTFSKADIIKTVTENGFNKKEARKIVESLIEIIMVTLENGKDLLISGFGKFSVKRRKFRSRNFQTGHDLFLGERRIVTFRPSSLLRKKLNVKGPSLPREITSESFGPRDATSIDGYYSVEIPISGTPYIHKFKIWDISSKGRCVLVKEGSYLLKYLKAGDMVSMRYFKPRSPTPTECQETEIRHITRYDDGRFKGHYLVGI